MQITDAHVHIFPEAIAQKAARAIGDFYDGAEMFGNGTAQAYLSDCKKAGITRAFVHSVATTPQQIAKINGYIASQAAASNGLFIGFATMHAECEDMEGELDHAQALGLVGVKLHPDMQRFAADDPRCMRLYGMMQERKMPLVLHAGDRRFDFSNPDRIAHILHTYPRLHVQAAHLGGYSVWEDVPKYLADTGVYTDISSSMFALTEEKVVELIRFFGADRVMFGSDYPMWSVASELERFMHLPLDEKSRRMILNTTANSFLQE